MDDMGFTCFIPAQRQSSGFRPKGPSVGEDFDSRIALEVEHLLRERPALSALVGAAEMRRRSASRPARAKPVFAETWSVAS